MHMVNAAALEEWTILSDEVVVSRVLGGQVALFEIQQPGASLSYGRGAIAWRLQVDDAGGRPHERGPFAAFHPASNHFNLKALRDASRRLRRDLLARKLLSSDRESCSPALISRFVPAFLQRR